MRIHKRQQKLGTRLGGQSKPTVSLNAVQLSRLITHGSFRSWRIEIEVDAYYSDNQFLSWYGFLEFFRHPNKNLQKQINRSTFVDQAANERLL